MCSLKSDFTQVKGSFENCTKNRFLHYIYPLLNLVRVKFKKLYCHFYFLPPGKAIFIPRAVEPH